MSVRSHSFLVPVSTVTESNTGGHWAKKNKRAKNQKQTTFLCWLDSGGKLALARRGPPTRIILTRLAAKPLDSDNLQSALKHVRDELAWLCGFTPVIKSGKKAGQPAYGVGDDKIPWDYLQEKPADGYTGVGVTLWWETP